MVYFRTKYSLDSKVISLPQVSKVFSPFSLFNNLHRGVKFTSFLIINVRNNVIHNYHNVLAVDKYTDKYLVVNYVLFLSRI